jgi:gliding motility-associated-like protein
MIVVTDNCATCDDRSLPKIDVLLCPGEPFLLAAPYADVEILVDGLTTSEFYSDILGDHQVEFVKVGCGVMEVGNITVLDCIHCINIPDTITVCTGEGIDLDEYFERNLIFDAHTTFNDVGFSDEVLSDLVRVKTQSCDDVGEFVLNFVKCSGCTVFAPNVFSPNGDGINDTWRPFLECGRLIEMEIFDRWGRYVYQGNGDNAMWDGSGSEGAGIGTGVYVYMIRYQDGAVESYPREKFLAGTITVVR